MTAPWHPRRVTLIALTGGIASGKSTIARRLAEHGAVIVDADAIVREVQQPGSPVLAEIAAAFGAQQPVSPNTDEAGRASNRRVEMAPLPKLSTSAARPHAR